MGLRRRIIGELRLWSAVGHRAADLIAAFAGTLTFVALHALFFTVWIGGSLLGLPNPDHYPFSFLTLVVSLEAIFLSAFILIAQRRESEASSARAEDERIATADALGAILAIARSLETVIGAIKHQVEEQDELVEEIHDAVLRDE